MRKEMRNGTQKMDHLMKRCHQAESGLFLTFDRILEIDGCNHLRGSEPLCFLWSLIGLQEDNLLDVGNKQGDKCVQSHIENMALVFSQSEAHRNHWLEFF